MSPSDMGGHTPASVPVVCVVQSFLKSQVGHSPLPSGQQNTPVCPIISPLPDPSCVLSCVDAGVGRTWDHAQTSQVLSTEEEEVEAGPLWSWKQRALGKGLPPTYDSPQPLGPAGLDPSSWSEPRLKQRTEMSGVSAGRAATDATAFRVPVG